MIDISKNFWNSAKCTHTLRPYDPGTAKIIAIAKIMAGPKKLVKIRHYKGADGSTRRTIEIEI